MNEQSGRKNAVFSAAVFLLLFYIVIMMYIFFAMLHIYLLPNFAVGMAFEIIGFCFLAVFILGNAASKRIKSGYFIPLVIMTVFYTILLNLLNVLAIAVLMPVIFLLLHFVLLFFYCLVFWPMYILGKQ